MNDIIHIFTTSDGTLFSSVLGNKQCTWYPLEIICFFAYHIRELGVQGLCENTAVKVRLDV